MRATTDLPRRPRARNRVPLAITAAVVMVLITSLRGTAGFYTDYLWFDQLHFTEVWRNVLSAKAALAIGFTLVFFIGLWVSLRIAERFAPRLRSVDSELSDRYREAVGVHAGKVRIAVAALFALVAGSGVTSQWETWLLFRNSVPFGTKDPQFGRDVSFFVFRLPFLSFITDWLFVAVVIVIVVTAVAYYLNGGIIISQGVQRVTPAVKAHLSVLLGLLALVKAADYWVQRFELSYSSNGHVLGLGYTDVQARLPALDLLVLISVAAALLFLANIRLKGVMLPVIAVGLWILVKVTVGGLYPWFKQSVQVQPNEAKLEQPYIRRNIEATRAAIGLDDVEVKDFAYDENLTAGDLAANAETIRNVRLWDPKHTQSTYQRLQGLRSFYELADLDVDRYQLEDERQQTIVSVRELDSSGLPAGNRSWVNTHLKYTHGYGAIVAPANAVTTNGQPSFTLKDLPPAGMPAVKEPRIYFGEEAAGYAVVKTGEEEIDYLRNDGVTETTRYTGNGGVAVGSALRRAAFALRFADVNLMLSKPVSASSRVMYVRTVGERVRMAAPFLRYDADPYPVLLDGKVLWVQDAYTVTDRYPYAQRADSDRLPGASGLHQQLNYVRNSVKVVIDAHDGAMTFYVTDDKDPLIKAYQKAFPKLFTNGDRMPAELRQHLRYPEDLFRLQTNMYGRYHITDPGEFFQASDAWDVSQDPGSGPVRRSTDNSNAAPSGRAAPAAGPATIRIDRQERMDPAYLLMKLPNEDRTSFLLLQPFVPTSEGDKQQNLTSFMVAKSDPDDYGRLQVFVMPRGRQVAGPRQVASIIEAEETISKDVTQLNREGSRVIFGNLLVIPVEESLLYIRPLYVSSESSPLPELKQVIVVYGDDAVMRPTLKDALATIFGDAPATLEEGDTGVAPPPTEPGKSSPPATGVDELLDRAKTAFDQADAALKNGDLAGFQRKIGEARAFIDQARQKQVSTTTSTTAPSSA